MKKSRLVLFMLPILFFLVSCASIPSFVAQNASFSQGDVIYLEPITVISFHFFQDEDIRCIMDKKLAIALSGIEQIILCSNREDADYFIVPELIIKSYQQKYDERNYYLLSISVLSTESKICQFNYEHNGKTSLFNSRVQNRMVKKLLNDFQKLIKK